MKAIHASNKKIEKWNIENRNGIYFFDKNELCPEVPDVPFFTKSEFEILKNEYDYSVMCLPFYYGDILNIVDLNTDNFLDLEDIDNLVDFVNEHIDSEFNEDSEIYDTEIEKQISNKVKSLGFDGWVFEDHSETSHISYVVVNESVING